MLLIIRINGDEPERLLVSATFSNLLKARSMSKRAVVSLGPRMLKRLPM